MNSPLPKKKIEYTDWQKQKCDTKRWERVLFFNPKKLYKRLGDKLDPYKRHQGFSMDLLFPQQPGRCACGCKVKPKTYGSDGKTFKWATESCSGFASDVLSIINNYFGKPAFYISLYYGHKCSECPETKMLELDHIVGVKHGGGGCWLSNYRWLCKACHTKKTNKDFKRKEFKQTNQLNLL